MNLILLILLLLLIFGGGGFYLGGPIHLGSGVGVVLLIFLVLLALGKI